MINYEIEQKVLLPHVPFGTELDKWNGKAFVSIVGFLFLNTKILGIPIPFHRNFEEVNLRFYVRRRSNGEWRRGVVFLKELVPRFAIAATARLLYNENYSSLEMNHSLDFQNDISIRYGWKFQNEWHSLEATATGKPQPMIEGSEAEFISEHYWGYAAQKDGGCVEYKVEHPRWRVWAASKSNLRCNVAALYGSKYVDALSTRPSSAFVAEGSPVIVRKGVRIK